MELVQASTTASPPFLPNDDLWERLVALPETVKGEIIDGKLYAMPRGRFRHMLAIGFLVGHLGVRIAHRDGSQGWWILPEPGIELPSAREVSPDIAGWRLSTMPQPPPPDEPIRIVPDWVCEVLSPSTAHYDLGVKLEFYARIGVSWAWYVDTRCQTIHVMELEQGSWKTRLVCGAEKTIALPPFEAIEIPIDLMWIPFF